MNQQQRGEELELGIVGAQVMERSLNVNHTRQPLQQHQRPASCSAFNQHGYVPSQQGRPADSKDKNIPTMRDNLKSVGHKCTKYAT